LNSILHDIPSFTDQGGNIYYALATIVSSKLQNNVFQTIEYMYSHKFITADALRKFLTLKNTLHIAAFHRVLWPKGTKASPSDYIKVVNAWNALSLKDRRFYHGKLGSKFHM
jgi:hypothetical protein